MKRHEFKNPVPVRERMAEKWKNGSCSKRGILRNVQNTWHKD